MGRTYSRRLEKAVVEDYRSASAREAPGRPDPSQIGHSNPEPSKEPYLHSAGPGFMGNPSNSKCELDNYAIGKEGT
jgi:hypothetical protein